MRWYFGPPPSIFATLSVSTPAASKLTWAVDGNVILCISIQPPRTAVSLGLSLTPPMVSHLHSQPPPLPVGHCTNKAGGQQDLSGPDTPTPQAITHSQTRTRRHWLIAFFNIGACDIQQRDDGLFFIVSTENIITTLLWRSAHNAHKPKGENHSCERVMHVPKIYSTSVKMVVTTSIQLVQEPLASSQWGQ